MTKVNITIVDTSSVGLDDVLSKVLDLQFEMEALQLEGEKAAIVASCRSKVAAIRELVSSVVDS